jgi:hypothetical protein
MIRIPLRTAAVALALVVAATPAIASSVSTAWVQLTSRDQEDCLAIGSRAIESTGFRANISQDRQTIFGWRGEEALTVRCISGHGVAVVFAWVTDQANDSGPLVEAVTAAYRNRGGLGAGRAPGGNLGGGNLGPGNFGGGGGGGVVKR